MLFLKRRMVSAIAFTLLLVGMFAVTFKIQTVNADSGTVYIRADGSIDPPTAPISTVDNVTYTLTGNINDSIVIERDNIVVDGALYTMEGIGIGSGNGIILSGRTNVTVKNMTIRAFDHCIGLVSSSSHNTISGNNITTSYGLGYALFLTDSSSNIISGNNITNSGGGILLDNSAGNSISGNNIIANIGFGIYFDIYSDNNTISGNNITSNGIYGIGIYVSSFNSISSNNVTANNFDGIDLGVSSSYNSVSGNNVTNNGNVGIELGSSSNHNNNVSENNVANNSFGISIWLSSSNSIIGNKFINNGIIVQPGSYPNSVENNTVNGKPLVYLEGMSNYTVDDAGQVVLIRCDNITVEDLNLSRTDIGIELWETGNCTISGNNISANNFDGIDLWVYSSYNNIIGNNITANSADGIYLYTSSDYNSIIGNNITGNKLDGIEFYGFSSNNSVFHNNFINNAQQVSSSESVNVWDDGYPSGGNYWSDYNGTDIRSGPYQNETGSDGIGDTPYVIDANNKDRYPRGVFRLAGDLNGDGVVDILDAVQAASAFGSSPRHPNWNGQVDLNNDGIIDIFDLIILASNFGKTTA
jgi:parallel beta-helix repeat protein